MGIITMGMTTTIMCIRQTAFAPLCFVLATACAAQVKVRMVGDVDPNSNKLTFTVENRSREIINVCMSDDLNMGHPGVPGVSPFYLETYIRGKWRLLIGSDIALRFIDKIDPSKKVEFSIHKLQEAGRYRVVMEYHKGGTFKDCGDLSSSHLDKVHSGAFVVP